MANVMKKPLPRRTFLKGSGVAVGLPFLEAMVPARASAQAMPKRFLVAMAGQVAYAEPHTVGRLPATMPEGWSSLQAIKDRISIVSRMAVPTYNKGLGQSPQPGGAFSAQHYNSYGPMLSGTHSVDGVAGGDVRGETIDHVIGSVIGTGARFPVLGNITQASNYNGRPVVESYSRQRINGTLQNYSGHRTPTELYAKLFSGFSGAPAGGTTGSPATVSNLLQRKKSVLDLVDRGSAGVLGKLSPADRARVEEHFAQIRNLEKSLVALPPNMAPTMACGRPTPPMAETPPSSHSFGGWANETYRGQVGADILALAFACDLTRSVMWMITRDQSWLGTEAISGIASEFHQMGHEAGNKIPLAASKKNMSWVAGLWGRFVDNISRIKEGSGTVLDNTFTTLLFSEGGSPHNQNNHQVPFAGMPSRFKIGEWIDAPAGTHPANYLIGVMQGMGINKTSLGEINGPFTGILK